MEGEDEANVFGEEVNSILREDSLIRRMSPYLNELITTPNAMQRNRHESNERQQGYVAVLNGIIHPSHQALNNHNLIEGHPNYYQHHQHHHFVNNHDDARLSGQQMQHPPNAWDGLEISHHSYGEEESQDSFISNTDHQHTSNIHLRPQDQHFHVSSVNRNTMVSENDASFVTNPNSVSQIPPNHEPAPPPSIAPSLQPWNGICNFKISLTNNENTKWCYNEALRKLYLFPLIAAPVDITVERWCDASVRITPVYKQSQHRMDPVNRCFNCKSKKVADVDANLVDHIVQIEGEACQYEVIQDRHVVTVPLSPPPPGEESKTLFIKLMCMTSCVGGPNRRPFCLVFTLICNLTGREIGRQIIEVKCCKCPQRDMKNERSSSRSENIANNHAAALDEKQANKIGEIVSQIQVGQKRKKLSTTLKVVTKTEPEDEDDFVNIRMPAKYVRQVKRFINGLIAIDILKGTRTQMLLYSESEGDE